MPPTFWGSRLKVEPESGLISLGLRFIVRGDVMLKDGSFLTLDELAQQAGVEPLPFLEDMPDELDL